MFDFRTVVPSDAIYALPAKLKQQGITDQVRHSANAKACGYTVSLVCMCFRLNLELNGVDRATQGRRKNGYREREREKGRGSSSSSC